MKFKKFLGLCTILVSFSITASAFSLPTDQTTGSRIQLSPNTMPQTQPMVETEAVHQDLKTESHPVTNSQGSAFSNLRPLSKAVTASMPASVSGGTWTPRRVIQGVEWNSDVKNIMYFSYARHIAAYDLYGNLIDQFDTDYYFTDMDYFEGRLFATWRNEQSNNFGVYIFDAQNLSNYHFVSFPDVQRLLSEDRSSSSSDAIRGCIDGVTIAPAFGSQDDLKLYVSYGAWDDNTSEMLCLRDKQLILEYDLDNILSFNQSASAERILNVDLGRVKFGIQSLEYDRDTGNVWCATRKVDNYSLYCLDKNSSGTTISLIPNGTKTGWDCEAAGDGLCSLGNDTFYILVPTYGDNQITGTSYKITSRDFNSFNK